MGADREAEEEKEDKKKGPAWKKPQQKKKAKKSGKPGKQKKKAAASKPEAGTESASTEQKETGDIERPDSATRPRRKRTGESGSESEGEESGSEESGSERDKGDKSEKNVASEDDEEEQEWARFQRGVNKREKALSGKSRVSHSVHSPYFTDDKQEFWWVYISDRKSHSLITPPYHLTSLVMEEEVELKFTAPSKEGIYNFTVCVRSDSYLGTDLTEDIKLDVQKAWEAPTEHKQWEFEDESGDDEGKEASEESEYATDDDYEDESD